MHQISQNVKTFLKMSPGTSKCHQVPHYVMRYLKTAQDTSKCHLVPQDRHQSVILFLITGSDYQILLHVIRYFKISWLMSAGTSAYDIRDVLVISGLSDVDNKSSRKGYEDTHSIHHIFGFARWFTLVLMKRLAPVWTKPLTERSNKIHISLAKADTRWRSSGQEIHPSSRSSRLLRRSSSAPGEMRRMQRSDIRLRKACRTSSRRVWRLERSSSRKVRTSATSVRREVSDHWLLH